MSPKHLRLLQVLTKALAPALKDYVAAHTAPLLERITSLEQRDSVSYKGVWQEGHTYDRGSAVTRAGSLWIAKEPTAARPGDPDPAARAWQLAVKRGQA